MKKVKYIRVSTLDQSIERQNTNSSMYSMIYVDRCSGALKLSDRKNGRRLIADITSGKVEEIHVSSIDRLGRDIVDILIAIELFSSKGVNLFVENVGMYSLIDRTPNPTFKMMVSVLGNVAEMERLNMLERQKQGIRIAKAKGVYKGRIAGSSMSKDEILAKYPKVIKELQSGESLRRTAALCGCSLGTVQKVKRLITG